MFTALSKAVMVMRLFNLYILQILCIFLSGISIAQSSSNRMIYLLDIKGAIGPATSDYIDRGLKKAQDDFASMIILRIDTPGGLDTSMRIIIKSLLNSRIPVISYVAPSGSRAASAGTYILYASHITAMAPGTNLGAATPVQIGYNPIENPKGQKDSEKQLHLKPGPADKALSDAVAYIRSLAQLRGKDPDQAEKFVHQAISLSSKEAFENKVIDLIANDIDDLLEKINGWKIIISDTPVVLKTTGANLRVIEPDWRTKLLSIMTPTIAYFLLLAGLYGLIFEFTHPGAIAPGVIGGISLLLAIYGLHLFPIDYVGLALIIMGIAFMAVEAVLPTFGALGIGGIIAFVIGSVMLFDIDAPGIGISWPVLILMSGFSILFFFMIFYLAYRSRYQPVINKTENIIGLPAQVTTWKGNQGRVHLCGESWRATSQSSFAVGETVVVHHVDDLTLHVVSQQSSKGEK